MEISQITLAKLLLYSFLLGLAIGALYDAGRLLRLLLGVERANGFGSRIYEWTLPVCKKTMRSGEGRRVARAAVINICDFLCVIAATLGILILSYAYNSGRVRFFVLLGATVGFFLYRAILSKILMLACRPMILLFRYLFLSFLAIFCTPFAKMYRFVLKYIKKIAYLYIFTLEKRREKVYNIEEEVLLAENSKKTHYRAHRIMPDKQREGGEKNGRK